MFFQRMAFVYSLLILAAPLWSGCDSRSMNEKSPILSNDLRSSITDSLTEPVIATTPSDAPPGMVWVPGGKLFTLKLLARVGNHKKLYGPVPPL